MDTTTRPTSDALFKYSCFILDKGNTTLKVLVKNQKNRSLYEKMIITLQKDMHATVIVLSVGFRTSLREIMKKLRDSHSGIFFRRH